MKALVLFCFIAAATAQITFVSANQKTPIPLSTCESTTVCNAVLQYPSATIPIAVESSLNFQASQAEIQFIAQTPVGGALPATLTFCLGSFAEDLTVDCSVCAANSLRNAVLQGNTYTLSNLQQGQVGGGSLAWSNQADEITPLPRPICIAGALTGLLSQFTGFFVEPVFNCVADTACALRDLRILQPISNVALAEFAGRTRCCVSSLGARLGQCVNPNTQSCCGGTPFLLGTERCCSNNTERVTQVNANPNGVNGCPCNRASEPAATTAISVNTDCPPEEPVCCLANRFPELVAAQPTGVCYSPARARCCNNGLVYDPSSQQCCVVSGVQTLNQPCPCDDSTQCRGAQITPNGQVEQIRPSTCCRQTAPAVLQTSFCSPFANFPTGQAPSPATVRCTGFCIDPTYQTCCNGVVCMTEFEKCCNNTCCNRHVGSCQIQLRSGAAGQRNNYLEYNVEYNVCTTIESLQAVRVFRVFVVPAMLLLLTLLCSAIALTFASKASPRGFIFLEKAILLVAVFLVILASFLYFSPMWKYGLFVVLVSLIAILSVASRLEGLNIFALVAVLLIFIYIIDPWHGNNYLNLTYLRLPGSGNPDPQTAGVWYTTLKLYRNLEEVRFQNWCAEYFDYFAYDPQLRDYDRLNNPLVPTFGYCSRGWLMALLIIEGILTALLGALLLLVALAWVLRFRIIPYEPVELELREVGDDIIIG